MDDFKDISSDTLAAQVVVYKALGINKELAIQCMKELAVRRENGDLFEYEKYIETEVAKIPKIEEKPDTSIFTKMIADFVGDFTNITKK